MIYGIARCVGGNGWDRNLALQATRRREQRIGTVAADECMFCEKAMSNLFSDRDDETFTDLGYYNLP